MSVCGQTEEDSVSEEPAGAVAPVREMYEQKAVSKLVRVLTVLAYLLSVSLAAILLSVYYVCVWKSPDLPPLNNTDGHPSALHADPPPNQTHNSYNETRGGNSTVSEAVPTATPPELSSLPASGEPPDPTDVYNSTLPDFNATWLMPNVTDQR